MIKMAAFDIDGTILPYGDKEFNDDVKGMFKRLKKKNITTVLCTGRNFVTIDNLEKDSNIDYFIGANGAFIVDLKNNEIIFESKIKFKDLKHILDVCDSNKINYSITSDKNVFFKDPTNYTDNWFWKNFLELIKPISEVDENESRIHQLTIRTNEKKDMDLIEEFISKINSFEINSKWDAGCFISKKGIKKSFGLKKLGEIINIGMDEIIAFGDGPNDKDMIEAIENSVVMAEGSEELKKLGKYVIGSANDNAVIRKLEELNII